MAAVMMGPGNEMRLVHRARQFVIALRMFGEPVNDVHGADGRAHVSHFRIGGGSSDVDIAWFSNGAVARTPGAG